MEWWPPEPRVGVSTGEEDCMGRWSGGMADDFMVA
jgi:hypothetical protein